jgi:hypothetical protein
VEETEEFEGPALQWLSREARRLADVLRRHGLDSDAARPLVEAFIFGMCFDLDRQPIMFEGRTYAPGMHFASPEKALAADDDTFAWHDYALGVVGEVFGDG